MGRAPNPLEPARAVEAAPAPAGWHPRHLLLAPHRLGFFLAQVVLVAAALWWALVQVDRATGWLALHAAVPPTLLHAAVMVMGFVPLFFGGFLFTAGPRWLGLEGPPAAVLAPCLLAQAAGWLLWLAGGVVDAWLALAGLALAAAGLGRMAWSFWKLVLASAAPDRLHARVIAGALALGTACLAGLGVALVADAWRVAHALVHTALWGFVVVVYVTVAHRMIPFFTSSALPMVRAWRPFWVLWMLLAVAGVEVVSAWLEAADAASGAWAWFQAAVEGVAGAGIVWLAWAWGLAQSLKVRLLAMLHLGFAWLGLGLLLSAASLALSQWLGEFVLPLAGLHAVTMGCLGSLLLAMVTRVSCGHSGRPLVADRLVWGLFWLLQAATVLRIAAASPWAPAGLLLALAALCWLAVMGTWGVRLAGWYGRLRADGRPG